MQPNRFALHVDYQVSMGSEWSGDTSLLNTWLRRTVQIYNHERED